MVLGHSSFADFGKRWWCYKFTQKAAKIPYSTIFSPFISGFLTLFMVKKKISKLVFWVRKIS